MRKIQLIVLTFLAIGSGFGIVTAQSQKVTRDKKTARQVFEEVFSQGKLNLIDQIYAEDYVDDSVGGGTGRDFLRGAVNQWRAGFPGLKITVEDLLPSENKITVRWTAHGTQTGIFNGIPPTGKEASVRGITIFEFSKGKIQKEWTAFDRMNLLQQLGIKV